MDKTQINQVSGKLALLLSLMALLAVLSGFAQPPQADAHIFQLSIATLFFVFLVFFASADWKQPLRGIRPLVVPTGALVLAFAVLY
jgi:hypothetical protein